MPHIKVTLSPDEYADMVDWYGSFNHKHKGIPVPCAVFNYQAHRNMDTCRVKTGAKRIFQPTLHGPNGESWTPSIFDQNHWRELRSLADSTRSIRVVEHDYSSKVRITKHYYWDTRSVTYNEWLRLQAANTHELDIPQFSLSIEYRLHLRPYNSGITIPEWLVTELGRGADRQISVTERYQGHGVYEEEVVFWEPNTDCHESETIEEGLAVRAPFKNACEEKYYTNLDKPLPEALQNDLNRLVGVYNGDIEQAFLSVELFDDAGEVINSAHLGIEVGSAWRRDPYVQGTVNELIDEALPSDIEIDRVVFLPPGCSQEEEWTWDAETRKVVW